MITLIIHQYLNILLCVGIASVLLLLVGSLVLLFLFSNKKSAAKEASQKIEMTEHAQDISAIAGDDIIATQLDLARAFIETDKSIEAKQILEEVLIQGDKVQQEEARNLLLVCAV